MHITHTKVHHHDKVPSLGRNYDSVSSGKSPVKANLLCQDNATSLHLTSENWQSVSTSYYN